MIYLDYAANTPVSEKVLAEFLQVTKNYLGNPNGEHQEARKAKEYMDQATKEIKDMLNCIGMEVIYTSGASEANNFALKGLARSYRENGKHIISTGLEHSSVSGTLTWLQQIGYEIDLVNIKRDGTVDLEHLGELIRKDTLLVSIGWVESELGILQPIEEIATIIKGKNTNCFFHVDATQAVGKIPLNLTNLDLLTFAPHKFYGLNGCGVLLKKESIILEPLIHGGKSTSIFRSGTPVAAWAGGIKVALREGLIPMDENFQIVKNYNQQLRTFFVKYPNVSINSPINSLPYFLNISIKGIKALEIQRILDTHGVCVSTKAACSVKNTPSRAVMAVTGDRKLALSSIRISLSFLTKDFEIEEFKEIFQQCFKDETQVL